MGAWGEERGGEVLRICVRNGLGVGLNRGDGRGSGSGGAIPPYGALNWDALVMWEIDGGMALSGVSLEGE